jgi:N-methylhydantoinase A
LLGSGPTGGVMGAALAADHAGITDFVAMDMGGTSFDVCLVRGGRPEIKTDWNWRYRYYIGLPMVDVQSIGAGGGSIARVRQGALLVGPESAGAQPGPVAYGRGGKHATVADADAALGYLPPTGFAGGRMTLDVDAARAAIARDVADPLGVDLTEAAWGIERIVNANMANETRRVLAAHGADARELALVAFGGNGAVHAWAIATELGTDRVLVPRTAPALSALGVLVADYVVDLVRAYVAPLSQVDPQRVNRLTAELREEAAKDLAPAGLAPGDVAVEGFAQMSYQGQNFDISVAMSDELTEPGLLDLVERFHDQHEADRGFAFRNQQPILRGVRVAARGHTPKPERLATLDAGADSRAACTGERDAYFGETFVATPTYDGQQLGPGATLAGPALIDEPFTVVVVPPGWTASVDDHGNYLLAAP